MNGQIALDSLAFVAFSPGLQVSGEVPPRSRPGDRPIAAPGTVGSQRYGLPSCALPYLVSEEPLDREVDADAELGFQLSPQLLQPHVVGVAHFDEEIKVRPLAIFPACHRTEDARSRSAMASQDALQLLLVALELAAHRAGESPVSGRVSITSSSPAAASSRCNVARLGVDAPVS
jgi:hypothetical protein